MHISSHWVGGMYIYIYDVIMSPFIKVYMYFIMSSFNTLLYDVSTIILFIYFILFQDSYTEYIELYKF